MRLSTTLQDVSGVVDASCPATKPASTSPIALRSRLPMSRRALTTVKTYPHHTRLLVVQPHAPVDTSVPNDPHYHVLPMAATKVATKVAGESAWHLCAADALSLHLMPEDGLSMFAGCNASPPMSDRGTGYHHSAARWMASGRRGVPAHHICSLLRQWNDTKNRRALLTTWNV